MSSIYVPESPKAARRQLRLALATPCDQLSKTAFVRAWCSVAYLLSRPAHPDGFEEPDSGWPKFLRRFAAEAWRRADIGELKDYELYPSDAQWSGLYDPDKCHPPARGNGAPL